MTTESFYVVAVEETQNWQGLEEAGIRAAFGLYLVREGEATFCCSLTPSSRAEFLRNSFIYDDGNKAAAKFAEEEEHNNGGDSGAAYIAFVRTDRHDSRFITLSCTVDPGDVDFDEVPGEDEAELREEYGEAIWNHALEYEQGNWHDPKIVWQSTYEKWQAERETA